MFPAGVHVASTWDTSLIYARGNAMGSEAKGVGVNVQLAPVAGKCIEGKSFEAILTDGKGALGKIPQGGRNWEGFAAYVHTIKSKIAMRANTPVHRDPYLTGVAMSNAIKGMQDAGVQACAKHYIGNEQERNRETMSANIDDRTLHELYLWPFADSVKAGVASFMVSTLLWPYKCRRQFADV